MKQALIALTVAGSTLLGTAATAAPLSADLVLPQSGIQNVRLVCDEYGRCWHQPRRRVVVRESYGYLPQETYVRREGYYGHGYAHDHDYGYYNRGPSVGIGVGPGGFGIGVGVGPSW